MGLSHVPTIRLQDGVAGISIVSPSNPGSTLAGIPIWTTRHCAPVATYSTLTEKYAEAHLKRGETPSAVYDAKIEKN